MEHVARTLEAIMCFFSFEDDDIVIGVTPVQLPEDEIVVTYSDVTSLNSEAAEFLAPP